MRITETAVASNLLENIRRTRERLTRTHFELSTGKKVNTVSDDPYVAESIMKLRREIMRNEQFQKNIKDALDFLITTSNAVDNFIQTMMEIRTMLVEVMNAGREPDYGAYAIRMKVLLNQLLDSANTRFRDKYIFNGTRTMEKPYEYNEKLDIVVANLSNDKIKFEVGEGIYEVVNFTADEIFQGTQVFDTIIQIKQALENGNRPDISLVNKFNDLFDKVVTESSAIGAMINRFRLVQQQAERHNVRMRELLSVKQDTDIAESAVKLKKDEIILESALKTAAVIIQKSIIDFLT